MSKIEAYKEKKRLAAKLSNAAACILGKDSPQNDKHTFRVSFDGLSNEDWSPMNFRIFASHGYYGSSSGTSDTSVDLGKYLAAAITSHASLLLKHIVETAEREAEKARKEAEDEAKSVLQETAPAA